MSISTIFITPDKKFVIDLNCIDIIYESVVPDEFILKLSGKNSDTIIIPKETKELIVQQITEWQKNASISDGQKHIHGKQPGKRTGSKSGDRTGKKKK